MRYLTKKNYALEEVESEGSWAISYGDMITLLLSFFVIFFTTDLQKEKVHKLNDYMSFSMEDLKQIPSEILKRGEKSTSMFDKKELEGLDVKIQQANNKIMVSFGRFSFFKSGQTDVRPEGIVILKKFVDKYIPYAGTYSLSIKGFTDKKRVSSINNRRYKDNLELSALRSISAMRVMQASGIPLNRMEIAGAGELHLIDELIPEIKAASDSEKNEYSRTIIIVISPEKESWL
jgi:flagellar motor protein MotB